MTLKQLPILASVLLVTVKCGDQPNIVLIVADDLGWADVPWHDHSVPAPNIHHLAHTGLILNQSYVQQVCTPSRAALLTGMYPYHLGRQHRALKPLRAGGIPTNFTLLPQLLKQQGYSTHMIGKWHLGYCSWDYTPTRRGFDTFYGTYLGVLDHWTHTRDKYDGYDFRRDEDVVYNASGVYSTHLYTEEAVSLIQSHQNTSVCDVFRTLSPTPLSDHPSLSLVAPSAMNTLFIDLTSSFSVTFS